MIYSEYEYALRLSARRVRVEIYRKRRASLRCAFTGRYMRAWVPVTDGPAWVLDVDASLAPEVTSCAK
jgi:hypothetical protein